MSAVRLVASWNSRAKCAACDSICARSCVQAFLDLAGLLGRTLQACLQVAAHAAFELAALAPQLLVDLGQFAVGGHGARVVGLEAGLLHQQRRTPHAERTFQAVQPRVVEHGILHRARADVGVAARLEGRQRGVGVHAPLARVGQLGAQVADQPVVGVGRGLVEGGQAELLRDLAAALALGSDQGQKLLFAHAKIRGALVGAVDLLGLHAFDEGGGDGVHHLGQALGLIAFQRNAQQVGVGHAGHGQPLTQALHGPAFALVGALPQRALLAQAGQRVAQHVVAAHAPALVLDELAVLRVRLEVEFLVFAQVAHVARRDLEGGFGLVPRLALLPRHRHAHGDHEHAPQPARAAGAPAGSPAA